MTILSCFPAFALAGPDWEVNLAITSGSVESKVSLGAGSDATDAQDGRYDVPAMLSGDLQARFVDGGGSLWRDIRGTDQEVEEWKLIVDAHTKKDLSISWNVADLPPEYWFELIDRKRKKTIAMEEVASYTLPAGDHWEFLIRAVKDLK